MLKHNQDGSAAETFVLILSITLLIAAIAFGAWAFNSRQDYKNNVGSKIQAAVKMAVAQEGQSKDNYYAQQAKFPLAVYNGPAEFGSLVVYYPKTWSAYVDDTGNGSDPVVGYFNPNFVPSIAAQNEQFALRVKVVSQTYNEVIQGFLTAEKTGHVTSSAYSLPKLPNVVGVKLSGEINSESKVLSTMVVLPLRSNAIEISTDGTQFLNDFNQNVLPNFSFSP